METKQVNWDSARTYSMLNRLYIGSMNIRNTGIGSYRGGRIIAATVALFISVASRAYSPIPNPELQSTAVGQAIADKLKVATSSQAAFIPAGVLKANDISEELSKSLLYPTDDVAIVELKGYQIRQALERSISFYPMASGSFLQLSGISASFSKSAPEGRRIQGIAIGENKLDEARTYSVAMPMTLARGGLGFFKMWERDQIKSVLPDKTIQDVVGSSKPEATDPRWTILP